MVTTLEMDPMSMFCLLSFLLNPIAAAGRSLISNFSQWVRVCCLMVLYALGGQLVVHMLPVQHLTSRSCFWTPSASCINLKLIYWKLLYALPSSGWPPYSEVLMHQAYFQHTGWSSSSLLTLTQISEIIFISFTSFIKQIFLPISPFSSDSPISLSSPISSWSRS